VLSDDLGGLLIMQQFTSPFMQCATTNQVSLYQFDVQPVHHCVRSWCFILLLSSV